MKFRHIVCVAALAAGALAHAQDEDAAKPAPDPNKVKFPGYTAQVDQTYVKVGDWEGKLDVYLPPKGSKPVPAIIKIHGGGWTHGSKVSPGGDYFHMGFALINVEYRFTQVAPAPAAIEDARCALKYVKLHAKEWNIDPNKIVLQGGSAGGQLVLMTGLLGNDRRFDGNCPGNPDMRVAAIIDDYGPTDFTAASWDVMKHNKSVMMWLGTHAADEDFKASVSPVTYVQKDSPPVIIFHGTEDHTVPVEQTDVLEAKLKANGVKYERVMVQGAGHGKFTHDQDVMEEAKIREFLRSIGVIQ